MQPVKTIDAHGGGAPLRVIVEGFPTPRGRTMGEKLAWARRHADEVRRVIMLEPRGHKDMTGAVLTEPVSAGSHAGVLFMHGSGFAPALDHGVVSLATVALERGLVRPGGDGSLLVFDTVAGTVRAKATLHSTAAGEPGTVTVTSVTTTGPPSFVVHGGVSVRVGARTVPVDVAFGGACYAVVDAEAAGVGLTGRHLPELRRTGMAILAAVGDEVPFVHPADPALRGVHGVVFTGPPGREPAALGAVLLFGDGQIAASPTESGTAVIVAVLDAIGLLPDGDQVVVDSLTGATWTGRVAGRTAVGEREAIVPEIRGSAWITGEHIFVVHPDDPLAAGFSA